MTQYRVQVSVDLKGSFGSTVFVYEIEAEKHGFATMEARKRALGERNVERVTMTTWSEAA